MGATPSKRRNGQRVDKNVVNVRCSPFSRGGSFSAKQRVTSPTKISSEERRLGNMLVQASGSIAVIGRYTCTRALEDDYELESKVLGSGMSGPVRLAKGKEDGRNYAVKSFNKIGLSAKSTTALKNEAEIYLTLDHPHIAQLEMVFETDDMLHLVMELMEGGELYDRLAAQKKYSEQAAADTIQQILLPVAYLHSRQIAHRDLKLENFLYQSKDYSQLKLIDFGFAKFWDSGSTMSQACGSLHYVAPEVLARAYTVQADMWSIGIIAYMLLLGSPPFHGDDADVIKRIKLGIPQWSSRFPKLSEQAQSFVRSLLVYGADSRLTVQQALKHPWIADRKKSVEHSIDVDILANVRSFAHASHFRRATLSMMAWSLSTEDRAKLSEQFLLLDIHRRGTITHKDLKQTLENNFEIDSAEIEALFKSLDDGNDKEIEYTEFLSAALLGRVKVHEDVLRKTFARFDRDCNGTISIDELQFVLGNSFEREEVEDMIREADTTGDGMIDYDEFIAYFNQAAPEHPSGPKKMHAEKMGVVIDRLVEEAREIPMNTWPACAAGSLHSRTTSFGKKRTMTPHALPTLLSSSRVEASATKPLPLRSVASL